MSNPVELASRYKSVSSGPRTVYLWENQNSVPIEGTSPDARLYSPFTLSFVPPDILTATQVTDNSSANITAIANANKSSDNRSYASSTAKSGNQSASISKLQTFVASGQKYSGSQSGYIPKLADQYTAADIKLQLEIMQDAEPLTLLVNPTEFAVSYTKIQNFQNRTRNGLLFEAWGTDQPTVTISGTTAGFCAGSLTGTVDASGNTDTATGYQFASRLDSAAWQNFMSLYQFYRSNGYIYNTLDKSEAHLFIGSIAIDYDQMTYIGNIESFNFSFDSEQPHRVAFDMDFRVNYMLDNSTSSSSTSAVGRLSSVAIAPSETGQFNFDT